MSVQVQITLDEQAQWSAIAGTTGNGTTTGATGTVTLSAPIGWRKLYAMRMQYPGATAGPGLTGYIEFQPIQNSVSLLPNNEDPYRVPITDDSEVVVYSPPNPALNLQFLVRDLRYQGTLLDAKAVRLFVLHTLEKC